VTSLVQYVTVVLGREVRGKQPYCEEIDPASGQMLEYQRESPRRTGNLDAVVRRVLREMKSVRAVTEQ
jgi:hypothetical protein